MKKKKDKQFKELLVINSKLIDLGSDLARAIQDAKYPDGWTMTPHLKDALFAWHDHLNKNYQSIGGEK
jgi:hypothetical protein